MRKTLAVISVLAMVLVGFMAMTSPVGAKSHGEVDWFWNSGVSACGGFENDAVPVGMFVGWIYTISIENTFTEDMTDVVVKDKFTRELMVCQGCPGIPDPSTSQGSMELTTKGKTEKVFLEWDVGTIPAGESAMLMLVIGTDMNPKGHQEFTSTGPYELNNGAILRYDMGGFKWRETTDPIPITVVEMPPP
ncbi:MAG: hypothetical protein JSV09_09860 [Thermoplasmata archaeon]|nr:MAG: hypothetical protein JSV09_09860 [Thermoplasmata archaeon]